MIFPARSHTLARLPALHCSLQTACLLQGRDYLLSWRLGCSKFKQDEAERFCRANGMRPVSAVLCL